MTNNPKYMETPVLAEQATRDSIEELELLRRLTAHRPDVSTAADDLIDSMTTRVHVLRMIQIEKYRAEHNLPVDPRREWQLVQDLIWVDEKIANENLVMRALLFGEWAEA